ncbi:hypothetical protein Lal_00045061 [Lupinus albus]|nr:hypothetical protein Lal_00045061 [Lupinus albus]
MEDEDSQRNNIFHSRCLVYGKVCLLMIDSGSHANIVSSRVVKKLNLITIPHPSPYRLQRSNEDGEVIVNKQVGIPFSIGKYEDLVLCDVAHNGACHIILGRPWQYDKRTLHDCFSNKITFLHLNRKVVLSSLSPKQVKEDQRRLREKLEEERKETLCEKQECEIKSKGLCLDSNFHEETLVHNDVCLDVQELPKEASKILTSMEPQDIEKDASNLITQSITLLVKGQTKNGVTKGWIERRVFDPGAKTWPKHEAHKTCMANHAIRPSHAQDKPRPSQPRIHQNAKPNPKSTT